MIREADEHGEARKHLVERHAEELGLDDDLVLWLYPFHCVYGLETTVQYRSRRNDVRAVISPSMLASSREALGLSKKELGRRVAPILNLSNIAAYQRVRRFEDFQDVRSLSVDALDALRTVFIEAILLRALGSEQAVECAIFDFLQPAEDELASEFV